MLLKQIEYFLAIAQHRHFTKAANSLFISQSALSQQINKLEASLGLKLLKRDTHPIELTPAGEELAIHANKISADITFMHTQLQKYLSPKQRTIRLGMITGLGNTDIAKILSTFTTTYPNINFTILTSLSKELCKMLQAQTIDLALFAAPYNIEDYGFDVLTLDKEEFVLIVPSSHPLADKTAITLSDTIKEHFIFPTQDNVSYDIFMAECKKAGFAPHIISQCSEPGRRIDLVRGGLGIAFISRSGLRHYNTDNIAVLHLQQPFYKQMVLAKTKQEQVSPLLLSLWNYICQTSQSV